MLKIRKTGGESRAQMSSLHKIKKSGGASRFGTGRLGASHFSASRFGAGRLDSVILLIIALSVIALFVIGSHARWYGELFFATPRASAVAQIENATGMNVTFESVSESRETNVFSVNHTHARIMQMPVTNGSFFTQAAQNERRSVTVLNETLAFETFGSFDIIGNTYMIAGAPHIVVGVVNDGSGGRNAYIPAIETAVDFLVATDTVEGAIMDLRLLGVNDLRFHKVNISGIAEAVRGKPWLAVMIAAGLILLVVIRRAFAGLAMLVRRIKLTAREKYWGELIKTADMRNAVLLVALITALGAAVLWMLLRSVEIGLLWSQYAGALNGITSMAFGGRVQILRDLCLYSNIAFGVFSGGILIGFCRIIRRNFV